MSRALTAVIAAVGTLALLVVVGLIVIFTGAYDISATEDHAGLTEWAFNTLQHSSVSRRAESVTGAPPTDSAALEHGLIHYDAMCVTCHGAPGIDRGELGQGITPTPPDLAEELHEWSDAELFWITKHGIRLAGMPAFGPTHTDEELWGIVGFLKEMETMTPEEYAGRVAALDAGAGGEGEAGHSHPPGTPEHHHQ